MWAAGMNKKRVFPRRVANKFRNTGKGDELTRHALRSGLKPGEVYYMSEHVSEIPKEYYYISGDSLVLGDAPDHGFSVTGPPSIPENLTVLDGKVLPPDYSRDSQCGIKADNNTHSPFNKYSGQSQPWEVIDE